MINETFKISKLARSTFVTPGHEFLIVRNGVTTTSTWSALTDTDVLVFSQDNSTFGTTFAELSAVLSGGNTGPQNITLTAGADSDPVKISQLNRADFVGSAGIFVTFEPGSVAAISGNYYNATASNTKGIEFQYINALLSPGVLVPVVVYAAAYEDDAAAAIAGVLPCGLYRIIQANNYGIPSPLGSTLVREATDCAAPTYASQAAAEAGGIQIGDVYSVSAGNIYGIVSAGGRGIAVAVDGATPNWKGPFSSFATAASGGVQIGEAFIVSQNNDLGIISADNVPIVRVQ